MLTMDMHGQDDLPTPRSDEDLRTWAKTVDAISASETLGMPGAPYQTRFYSERVCKFLSLANHGRSFPGEKRTPADQSSMDTIAADILAKPATCFAEVVEQAIVAWVYANKVGSGSESVAPLGTRAADLSAAGILMLASKCSSRRASPSFFDLNTPLTLAKGASAGLMLLSDSIGCPLNADRTNNAVAYLISCLDKHLHGIDECYAAACTAASDHQALS